MKKSVKKAVCILMLYIFTINLITGCNKKLTPEKLMSEVTENLAKVNSVSNSLNMDIELEDVLDSTKITMDMEMENTASPMAGHASGEAEVEMSGTKVGSDIEIYQVTEDNEFVTYSSMYGQWVKENSGKEEESTFNGNLLQKAGNSIRSFRIAKETVTVDEKECYEMYGDISGKELLQFMGTDMMGAFGLVEIPDENAIMKLQIPITIDIYIDEMLPARIMIDMTDVMNDLYDQNDKSTNVNNFMIKLGYTGFNKVDKIEVPQAVKSAVEAAS